MKSLASLLGLAFVLSMLSTGAAAQDASCADWLDADVKKLNSADIIDLCAETAGKPVLLVNTASYCGFTYQFEALESLYQRYKDQGLVVVGFPSDNFNQEDDDAAKTAEICYINYGVSFLMTDVVNVRGDDAHPIFAHVGAATQAPNWNFNKYLISKDGEVMQHFGSRVEPDAEELVAAIEGVL